MRIHINSKDLLAITEYLGIRDAFSQIHHYLDNRTKQTGDTFIVHTKWNKIQWSPGESSRIVK